MTTTVEWRKWNAVHTKTITHYDLLIRKTPEELAKWIESIEPAACPFREDHGDDCHYFGTCTECWLDWLKQEVEEDDK